ncbi:MAG: Flp family type IVb pilin [Alphaproteobacteria bacterium]|nr:Flp family type IVb pilin [Alphaproteobacteria bacterium]
MQELKRFLAHCSGATAIEYAMIAGGIALVIVTLVYAIGGQVSALLLTVSGGL